MSIESAYLSSPLGWLELTANQHALLSCNFVEQPPTVAEQPVSTYPVLTSAVQQLQAYFAGQQHTFDIPVQLEGTVFRCQVWQQLQHIPYGETRSYGDIATALDKPQAARAIGQANHHNPLSIIVPCHRVIGRNGKMTGYGSGIWRKEWLLAHEQAYKS